ncbi:MAG: glycosyltransferase family protein [Granulosicoccus sp.]
MVQERPLRVLFYVQHLLGIGHLMRARRIVLTLRDHDFDVALVTGGMPLPGFEVKGIEHIELPPMAVSGSDFRTLVDAAHKPIDDIFRQKRCNRLLDTYRAFKPDIVLLEAFPFGRRQVRFELLPLIHAIENTAPRPVLLASIRDILQMRVKPGRDAETARLVNNHFDRVLVHGDPAFADLQSSFSHADQIADHILYTGLVCGPEPGVTDTSFNVVVSAGGGAVGAQLVKASIEASHRLPDLGSWCVITGPNLPEQDILQIVDSAPANVTVERFRSDFTALLAGAQLSVSQAGYNTVSDILQAGCRSVLVPFSAGGETEQDARAQRLKALGLATVLKDEDLSAEQLASAIQAALLQKRAVSAIDINTDGAQNTAKLLRDLAGQKR